SGGWGVGCNVEIKRGKARGVEPARIAGEALGRRWPGHLPAPLLSSFKDASLAAAREAAPEFARALLLDGFVEDWRARAAAVEATGINTTGKKLTAPWSVAVKQAGLELRRSTLGDGAGACAPHG